MKISLILILTFIQFSLYGQDMSLKVEISSDSILIGNYLEVRFTIENGAGDFEAPEFEGFDILSGPNTSSTFSMYNGKVSQKASYSFLVRPLMEGILYIDPASFESGETILVTEPVSVMVYPNPLGIEDNKTFAPESDGFNDIFSFPDRKYEQKPKPKKKNKLEKQKRKI